MSTTPTTGSTTPAPRATEPDPPLWQAPIFVLGLTAVLCVVLLRPFCSGNCPARVERELSQARQLLSKPDSDPEMILKLTSRVMETPNAYPTRFAEAAYLTGVAYARLGEKIEATKISTNSSRSKEHWTRAQDYLKQAEEAGLAKEQMPSLRYQLAKVAFHLHLPTPEVIAQLEKSIPDSGYRVEGYSLLTQAYLRLNPPDLARAIDANRRLRDLDEAQEADLTAAKLTGGELLLRSGNHTEAKRSLERIPEDSPAAIVVRARALRARCHQLLKQWPEAVALYGAALNDRRFILPEAAQAWYDLGLCHREQGKLTEATRAWTECMRIARGPEASAAALALAEARLNERAYDHALEALETAVAKIREPKDWVNPLLDLEKARLVFERAASEWRGGSHSDLTAKLLTAYAKLAPAERILQLRAEHKAEAARLLANSPPGTQQTDWEQKIQAFCQESGDAYAQLAALPNLKAGQEADFRFAAAQQYLIAKDNKAVCQQLTAYVQIEVDPQRLGEAWFQLGEAYQALSIEKTAQDAWRKCMEFPTSFQPRARYRLALAALREGNTDQAELALKQNLDALAFKPDPEVKAQSLFALTNIRYQRKKYLEVVRPLENVLADFKDHSEALRARWQLADSYRQLANEAKNDHDKQVTADPKGRDHLFTQYRTWLHKAANEFTELERSLQPGNGTKVEKMLTKNDVLALPFIAAECWFKLGKFDRALEIYHRLLEQYPSGVTNVLVLSHILSCHAGQADNEKVEQRLLQIQLQVETLSGADREGWQNWINDTKKILDTRRQRAQPRSTPQATTNAQTR